MTLFNPTLPLRPDASEAWVREQDPDALKNGQPPVVVLRDDQWTRFLARLKADGTA